MGLQPDLPTPRSRRVLAPNPGPMTLEGTNTWILGEPGAERAVVVDPGPDHQQHLDAVVAAGGEQGWRVALILLTHGHPDHAEGADRLSAMTGAAVVALDDQHCRGSATFRPGQRITLDGLEIEVITTPGHTSDSVSLLLPAEGALLTGDTVLGRGTTVVEHPDGRLGDYLDSLHRIRDLTDLRLLLPGHGPLVEDPVARVEAYISHRRARLAQVKEALDGGATEPSDIVRLVYADVDPVLWPAAELSVRAQLEHLRTC